MRLPRSITFGSEFICVELLEDDADSETPIKRLLSAPPRAVNVNTRMSGSPCHDGTSDGASTTAGLRDRRATTYYHAGKTCRYRLDNGRNQPEYFQLLSIR
jgi:hypothetical protein